MTMPQSGDIVSVIIDGAVQYAGQANFSVGLCEIYPGPGVQVTILPKPPAVGQQTDQYDTLPNGSVVTDEDGDDLVKIAGRWTNITTGQTYPAGTRPTGISLVKSLPS